MVPMLVSIATTGLAARTPLAATIPRTTKQSAITLTENMTDSWLSARERNGRRGISQRFYGREHERPYSVQRRADEPGILHLPPQVGEVGRQFFRRFHRATR